MKMPTICKLGIARRKGNKKKVLYFLDIPIVNNSNRQQVRDNHITKGVSSETSRDTMPCDELKKSNSNSAVLKISSSNDDNAATTHVDDSAPDTYLSTFNPANLSMASPSSYIRVEFNNQEKSTVPPICVQCKFGDKKKNITRYDCRVKLKHTALPWKPMYLAIKIDDDLIGADRRLLMPQEDISAIVRFLCSSVGKLSEDGDCTQSGIEIASGVMPIVPSPLKSNTASITQGTMDNDLHSSLADCKQHQTVNQVAVQGLFSNKQAYNAKQTVTSVINPKSDDSNLHSKNSLGEFDLLTASCCVECWKNHFTKKHCRAVLCHRYLPYSTTFHKMSLNGYSNETTNTSSHKKAENLTPTSNLGTNTSTPPTVGINRSFFDTEIPESEMFLLKVSAGEVISEWIELASVADEKIRSRDLKMCSGRRKVSRRENDLDGGDIGDTSSSTSNISSGELLTPYENMHIASNTSPLRDTGKVPVQGNQTFKIKDSKAKSKKRDPDVVNSTSSSRRSWWTWNLDGKLIVSYEDHDNDRSAGNISSVASSAASSGTCTQGADRRHNIGSVDRSSRKKNEGNEVHDIMSDAEDGVASYQNNGTTSASTTVMNSESQAQVGCNTLYDGDYEQSAEWLQALQNIRDFNWL